MKRIASIFILLLFTFSYAQAQPVTGNEKDGWKLKTDHALYTVSVDKEGAVGFSYFGPKAQESQLMGPKLLNEVPVRGGGVFTYKPILEVIFPDYVRDIELTFVRATVTETDGYQTLAIEQKDKFYPLTVISYIRVIPQYDILEKWIEVRNDGTKSIKIENLQSGSFALPRDQYNVTNLNGSWGEEFMPETTLLTTGTKTIEVRDFKSHGSSYFAIRPAADTEFTSGPVWFGMLNYSGNWSMNFFKRFNSYLQVAGGVNYWDTTWELIKGTSRTTPKMVIGFTPDGEEGAAHCLTGYVRNNLLPAQKRDKIRPVLYNSWYATTFDVTEEGQLALAKIAKEIGVELFVIDDGWFKGRVTDQAGLGDWEVDKNKFPDGLTSMIRKINDLGMDFGLWIEPEAINPNSDLYRKHPDWILHYPNRERTLMRTQSVLNLAREDVYQFLLKSFSDLLANNNIKFVKWDHNRAITQPGWPGETPEKQREVRLRYVDNLYRLLGELTSRFPDVWFEDCSGGGGRVDGAMLSYMDVAWASDNTDAVARQFIQFGYLSAFPANTMVGWVTAEDWQELGLDLQYKFNVSMQGVLGVGNNITDWSAEEIAVAKERIQFYKQIRDIVQNGVAHRLLNPFEGDRTAMQYMTQKGDRGVLMLYNRQSNLPMTTDEGRTARMVRLRGLDRTAMYTIEGYAEPFSGDFLMTVGLGWEMRHGFVSKVLKINKI